MLYNTAVMEPRIQYAKTSDGVNIAFWTLGEGMPLVHMGGLGAGHIQLEWQLPECQRWYERLAAGRKLVRYDTRGTGLSDRNVEDLSLEALVLDLQAVCDRLGLQTFALCGLMHSGPVAIAYAARCPGRVSHLILWNTYAQSSEWAQQPMVQSVRALMDKDWTFYTEAVAHTVFGWSEGEPARRYAALIRQSAAQEDLQRALAVINQFDVVDLLPQVRAPTLILQRRQAVPGVDVARGLTSRVPDARLALLEGESGVPYLGDTESVLQAIDEFLGETQQGAGAEPPPGAVHTILFTDVEGSTAMTQRLGDAQAREVLREHERITRECLKAHGGSEIKTMGDGFMASFGSATRSLECAIAIQRAIVDWAAGVGAHHDAPLRVRIGLNAGEPIAEDDPDGRGDLFGTAVIMAARIAAQAQGGEILASNVVRELVAGKGFLFADRGEVPLRGFEDPIRLFEVRWRE